MDQSVQFVLCEQKLHLLPQLFQGLVHRRWVRPLQGFLDLGADFLNRLVDRCIRSL